MNLDHQIDYWNRMGPGKPFGHPVNVERLRQHLSPGSRVLDLGCGYGRVLGLLFDEGYQNLIGLDPAPAMIALARERFPAIEFAELTSAPDLPLPDTSVDATIMFSVLTCVPTDEGQRAIVNEVRRVLKPAGLLYISDLWLQNDPRNLERYVRDQPKYGAYGVFHLPEGVTVRHHDPRWIEELTQEFATIALDDLDVRTMNGNSAKAFQWFGQKPDREGGQIAYYPT
ncbi:MAG: class I SAM-dependent methyltransferase [Pyrinomonadaceae bacterium]